MADGQRPMGVCQVSCPRRHKQVPWYAAHAVQYTRHLRGYIKAGTGLPDFLLEVTHHALARFDHCVSVLGEHRSSYGYQEDETQHGPAV
jgi:hypothetical protein